ECRRAWAPPTDADKERRFSGRRFFMEAPRSELEGTARFVQEGDLLFRTRSLQESVAMRKASETRNNVAMSDGEFEVALNDSRAFALEFISEARKEGDAALLIDEPFRVHQRHV